MVKEWYEEVANFNYENNLCGSGEVCGHYTQVVWATSRELGCGAYRCETTQGSDLEDGLYLVCNYGPGGNLLGQQPHVSGSSCSQCPQDQTFCVSRLCSVTDDSPIGIPDTGGATTQSTDITVWTPDTDGAVTNDTTPTSGQGGAARLQYSIVFLFIAIVGSIYIY